MHVSVIQEGSAMEVSKLDHQSVKDRALYEELSIALMSPEPQTVYNNKLC